MKTHNKSEGDDSFADMLVAIGAVTGEGAQTQPPQAKPVADTAAAPQTDAADAADIPVETATAEMPQAVTALPGAKPQAAAKEDAEVKPAADKDKPEEPANDNMEAAPPVPQQVASLQPVAVTPEASDGNDAVAPAVQAPTQPQAPAPQQAEGEANNEEAQGTDAAATPQADGQAAKPAAAKPARPVAFRPAAGEAKSATARTQTAKADAAPAQQGGNDAAQSAKLAEVPAQPASAAHNNPQPDALPVSAPAQAAGNNAAAAAAHEIATPAPHHAPDTDKLAVEIAARSETGAKQFDIRLDPPELGRVEVRLSIDAAGKAQAHLTADQPRTLDLLQKDAPVLTRALREAGLDVAQDGLNFSLRQQQQQAGHDQPAPQRGLRAIFPASTPVQPAPAAIASRGAAIGLLDIRV